MKEEVRDMECPRCENSEIEQDHQYCKICGWRRKVKEMEEIKKETPVGAEVSQECLQGCKPTKFESVYFCLKCGTEFEYKPQVSVFLTGYSIVSEAEAEREGKVQLDCTVVTNSRYPDTYDAIIRDIETFFHERNERLG